MHILTYVYKYYIGIQYIDGDIIAREYYKSFKGQPLTNMISKEPHAHIGVIRFNQVNMRESLLLSSYMTQNVLHHIC